MESADIEVADVFVVLQKECAEKLDETVAALVRLGMEIASTDADDGVVEGTLRADKLAEVKGWKCVEEVRIDFVYIAEQPDADEDARDAV